jgi:hypothetical protein
MRSMMTTPPCPICKGARSLTVLSGDGSCVMQRLACLQGHEWWRQLSEERAAPPSAPRRRYAPVVAAAPAWTKLPKTKGCSYCTRGRGPCHRHGGPEKWERDLYYGRQWRAAQKSMRAAEMVRA